MPVEIKDFYSFFYSLSVIYWIAGIAVYIFYLFTKKKVPVFLGSSFAFIEVIIAVKAMFNGDLAYAQGGIVVAGLVYVLLSVIVGTVKIETLHKILPAQVVGPMIIVIGLGLVPVAWGMASKHFLVAGITLIVALTVSKFGKGFSKKLGILIGVLTGYAAASLMGVLSVEAIEAVKDASIIAVPSFTLPKFSIDAIIVIVPVVVAVFMEHLGDITTNGAVVGKDFIKDPGLKRTILGDGLATVFAGLIGGPANTTYGENTGVLAITKNYNPAILRLSAMFAIVLAFSGKVGGALKTVPEPVMGGISMMLFSMIALIGFKTIKKNDVKFNWKNAVIIATILIIGLSGKYFGSPIKVNVLNIVTLKQLSLAAVVGIALNAVLNIAFGEK